jgi:hypothetical protein
MRTAAAYNHETVELDAEQFSECEFRDCRMIYRGGEPPSFVDCRFTGCDWQFEDAAASTLACLKTMWTAGGKAAVQSMIKTITEVAR